MRRPLSRFTVEPRASSTPARSRRRPAPRASREASINRWTRPPTAAASLDGPPRSPRDPVDRAGRRRRVERLRAQPLPDRPSVRSRPLPDRVLESRGHGLPAEDDWFEAEDGARLHAWWIPYPNAWGTILYCHGNNGNVTNRIESLQQLRRLGVNLFAFDYRGYGRSEGVPTEAGLYRDVRAAWDHLVAKREVRPRSILIFGHSLGGAVAIDGAVHREVGGLVVQSSFTQVRDMARTISPACRST